MTKIIFLGTGGGRFATIYQTRSTGGIYIQDEINISIDPGPGAILRMKQEGIDPTKIDLLLVSHCHPDHYADVDVIIEAMTMGGTQKRGTLIASESVIAGIQGFDCKASSYHQGRLENVHLAKPKNEFQIGKVKVTAIPTVHTDPSGIGFAIHTKRGIVTYSSDTSISDEVIESYKGTRLLILALTTPPGIQLHHHLSPENAVEILNAVRPEKALLTHFGLRAIKAGPSSIAQWIYENSNVDCVAAEDGMKVGINEKIEILNPIQQSSVK
jgi:ribonuclease BN (tRNA processing enzyme)